MRYAYVLNPAAQSGASGRRWPATLARLRAAGLDGPVFVTTAPGDAQRLAVEAASVADVVAVVGGDGTVGEVVAGLLGTRAALGLLPTGTGNDFARGLGVPTRLGAAVATLASPRRRLLDAARVRWCEAGDAQRERVFANSLGVGFTALAAQRVERTKGLGTHLAYLVAVLRTLREVRVPDAGATVTVDGARLHDGPLFLCEVGNGGRVGGGFRLVPHARPDDRRLGVCAVRHVATVRALRLLPSVVAGRHGGAAEVAMAEGTEVVVEAASPRLAVQVDGEIVSSTARRVEVSVLPGVLRVVAP